MLLSGMCAMPAQKAESIIWLRLMISKGGMNMSGTSINITSVMKSFFTGIVSVFLALVAMISGGKMGQIELEVTQPVHVSSEQIVIEMRNYTGKSLCFDEYFTLEKNEGGEWVPVEFSEDASFNDIAIILNPLGTYKHSINILAMFGHTLEAGEYKLTKQINQKDFSAVFTVTE